MVDKVRNPRPKIAGVPKSAIASTKQMIAPVLMAGNTSGNVMRLNRCQGVQPRFAAASSKDLFTAFSAVCVIRKTKGKNDTRWTKEKYWFVSLFFVFGRLRFAKKS